MSSSPRRLIVFHALCALSPLHYGRVARLIQALSSAETREPARRGARVLPAAPLETSGARAAMRAAPQLRTMGASAAAATTARYQPSQRVHRVPIGARPR